MHALAMWVSQVSPWPPSLLQALSFWDSDTLPQQPGSASVLANGTYDLFGHVFIFFRDVIYQLFCPRLDLGYLFILKCYLF